MAVKPIPEGRLFFFGNREDREIIVPLRFVDRFPLCRFIIMERHPEVCVFCVEFCLQATNIFKDFVNNNDQFRFRRLTKSKVVGFFGSQSNSSQTIRFHLNWTFRLSISIIHFFSEVKYTRFLLIIKLAIIVLTHRAVWIQPLVVSAYAVQDHNRVNQNVTVRVNGAERQAHLLWKALDHCWTDLTAALLHWLTHFVLCPLKIKEKYIGLIRSIVR